MTKGPQFDLDFALKLDALLAWRRDVRRFSREPVPQSTIDRLLDAAQLSPSVGNSQPWRWIQVESQSKRLAIRENFVAANAVARQSNHGDRAAQYDALKLEGLERAPLQLAVFCDHATEQGNGLGRNSMPETLDYSVVAMIALFAIRARAEGLGVGWLSILDPDEVARALGALRGWKFIAYLCVGWAEEDHLDPELERFGWQARTTTGRRVLIA